MANNNYIQQFTAVDIERYHKGLLSNKERHDLEKAALDDPFLADALEGYAVAGVNVAADMTDLKNRLGERVEGAKVVPLSAPRNSFRALRAAVMILFIAGAGYLVYQFGFNNKKNGVAKVEPQSKENNNTAATTINDTGKVTSTVTGGTVSTPVSETKNDGKTIPAIKNEQGPVTGTDKVSKTPETPTGVVGGNGEHTVSRAVTTTDEVATNKPGETQPVANVPVPAKTNEERGMNWYDDDAKKAEKKELAKKDALDREKEDGVGKYKTKDDSPNDALARNQGAQQQNNRNEKVAGATRRSDISQYNNNSNTFRGRVTDADNNAVPFANVTNVQDNNAGTYTDKNGYFNITYPDSVLTVQVKSVGFENNNVQLRNSVPTNKVVMQDDRKTVAEVTFPKQKINASTPAASRDSLMKLETPEPADGWASYNTYVLNNLEIPEDLKNKPTTESGEVQISFEVDKNGEPTNFKVVKSLCAKCDKEAIRLIKEGPKWKRNANKKGRTTVTINF